MHTEMDTWTQNTHNFPAFQKSVQRTTFCAVCFSSYAAVVVKYHVSLFFFFIAYINPFMVYVTNW